MFWEHESGGEQKSEWLAWAVQRWGGNVMIGAANVAVKHETSSQNIFEVSAFSAGHMARFNF